MGYSWIPGLTAAALGLIAMLPAVAEPPKAAVLRAGLPGEDAILADAVTAELARAGYDAAAIDADELCDPARLTPGRFALLALPNAAELPAAATESIDAYLRGGGDVIALNAPLWQRALIRPDGEWTDRDSYLREHAADPPEHVLFDFAPDSLAGWARSTAKAELGVRHETVAEGPGAGQRA
ncbi:MAG: hypothetical protein JXR94_12350, partial [Candidatus Hydrogenedentes bacterium]|nr:hypothetical protein [Candidatus Hydrogenedentota bacterium]